MKRLFIFILVALPGMVVAQAAVTNTGTLYISNTSDVLYMGSDFTNNAGSALTNNGQLYVRGNLANSQSSMVAGTGTLYLNGTSAQTISGTQPFRTFHLNTDNTAGITLNNNLSISGSHTFTNGIITTSSTPNYLVYEAGSSYSGAGDAKHVNGWVKKIGSSNFVFPVGNGTVQRTIALNGLSASSEFDVRYLSNTPDRYLFQTPLHAVDPVEYWSVQKISGGSAAVAMNWDFSKVYFPNFIIPDIRVAGHNGSLWTDNGGSASGNAATTGSITSNSISSFNLFTFGSISYVLPLSVTRFTAARVSNYTDIQWTSENETEADHFEVERSDNGVIFSTLSNAVARNSGLTEHYSFKDYGSIQRVAYYRLRSIDKSGRSFLSKVVAVHIDGTDLITLVNNPVHDRVNLLVTGNVKGSFNYRIHAMNGQLIQEGQLVVQGAGQYMIPLQKTTEGGTYSLELNNGLQRFTFKMLLQ